MKIHVYIFSVLLVVATVGCATRPPTALQAQAISPAGVAQVSQQPDQYLGATVRWGGVIHSVTNLTDHTRLEIIGKELDSRARPIIDGPSPGRFLAQVKGFIEPTEFKEGREVTVVGKVAGSEQHPIGEYQYTYPMVNAEVNYLWEERVEPKYYYYDPWFYDPWYWGYPRYPWWYYY